MAGLGFAFVFAFVGLGAGGGGDETGVGRTGNAAAALRRPPLRADWVGGFDLEPMLEG